MYTYLYNIRVYILVLCQRNFKACHHNNMCVDTYPPQATLYKTCYISVRLLQFSLANTHISNCINSLDYHEMYKHGISITIVLLISAWPSLCMYQCMNCKKNFIKHMACLSSVNGEIFMNVQLIEYSVL